MALFYRHLARGIGTAAALRLAKIALLNTSADPLYWAGFTASGALDENILSNFRQKTGARTGSRLSSLRAP